MTEEERVQYVRDLVDDSLEIHKDFHDAMTVELDRNLKFRHYHDDTGNEDKPQRVKPKGRQTWATTRHKSAQISRSEIYFDVRPVDREFDPAVADLVRGLMEQEIHNPLKRYQQVRDMVALGALAARVWYARLDWCPEIGPFGEILPALVDGRDLMRAPGFESIHDPRCPWVLELRRVRPAGIKAMKGWKNTSDIKADNGRPSGDGDTPDGRGIVDVYRDSSATPKLRESQLEEFVTVAFLWERNKPSKRNVPRPDGGITKLQPRDQYLQCSNMDGQGCGYKSATLGKVLDPTLTSTQEASYPAMMPFGCPTCGGDLHRIDQTVGEYSFSSDHSLTISAPYQGLEFYNGPWPFDMRSVPYLEFQCYPNPIDPIGQSETSVNWTMQIAHNLVMRLGLEHMMLAKPYWAIPEGVTDYKRDPWEFGDLQGLGIYFNPLDVQPGTMHVMQANGLPPAWGLLQGSLDSQLRQDMGTNDLSMSQENSRNIPVGTIQAMERVNELPVDHQIDRFRLEESIFFGVWFDMWRETTTEQKMVRYHGEQGRTELQAIKGADLPNVDLIVTANPALAKVDGEVIKSMQTLLGMPPYTWEFMARRLNIPISEVNDLKQQMQQDQQAQMQMQAQMGAPPPGAEPGASVSRPKPSGAPVSPAAVGG